MRLNYRTYHTQLFYRGFISIHFINGRRSHKVIVYQYEKPMNNTLLISCICHHIWHIAFDKSSVNRWLYSIWYWPHYKFGDWPSTVCMDNHDVLCHSTAATRRKYYNLIGVILCYIKVRNVICRVRNSVCTSIVKILCTIACYSSRTTNDSVHSSFTPIIVFSHHLLYLHRFRKDWKC